MHDLHCLVVDVDVEPKPPSRVPGAGGSSKPGPRSMGGPRAPHAEEEGAPSDGPRHCPLCNIWLNSAQQLADHKKAKRHRNKLAKARKRARLAALPEEASGTEAEQPSAASSGAAAQLSIGAASSARDCSEQGATASCQVDRTGGMAGAPLTGEQPVKYDPESGSNGNHPFAHAMALMPPRP